MDGKQSFLPVKLIFVYPDSCVYRQVRVRKVGSLVMLLSLG